MNTNDRGHSVRIDGDQCDADVTGGVDYPLTEIQLIFLALCRWPGQACLERRRAEVRRGGGRRFPRITIHAKR